MVSLKWRMKEKFSVLGIDFQRRHPLWQVFWGASKDGTHKAAAGLHGDAALAAQRTFLRLIAGNGQVEQRLGLDREFDFAAAAVNERTRGNNAPACFFNDLDGFQRGATRRPNIFNHKNVLVRLQRKSAAKSHRAAGVALDEHGRHSAAD